ncbi:his Kinase A domain protein [Lysobacter gummosus]|nr:his Kinase A domain protein [Lysobacter gummosus]
MHRGVFRWTLAMAFGLAAFAGLANEATAPVRTDSPQTNAVTRALPDALVQVGTDSQDRAQDTGPASSGASAATIPDSIVATPVTAPARTGPVIAPPLSVRSGTAALPRRVRVAVSDWGTMPFDDYNQGHPRGFSVELLEEILRPRGIDLEYVRASNTEDMLKSLCEGRVDLAVNVLITYERSRCLSYTDPILQVSMYAVKRKDDTRPLTQDNLKRMRMAVPAAMMEHTRNRQRYPQTELVPVADSAQALRAIEDDRADVYFEAPYTLDWYLRQGGYPRLELVPGTQIPPSMQQPDLAVLYAAPHAQLPLLKLIDEEIKRDPARVDRLRVQWLRGDFENADLNGELTSAQREWLGRLPKLRMVLNDNAAPLSARDNDGNPVGILPDYAQIVEDRLGIRFQPVNANGFKGAATALTTGAADLAVIPIGALPGAHWIYSQPIERIPVVIVTVQGAASPIGLESLGGKRVSVTHLHLTGRAVLKAAPEVNLVGVTTDAEGLKLLAAGKVDAHVGNLVVIDRLINTQYPSSDLQVTPAGSDEELAFAADRRLTPLMTIIDQQLATVPQVERQRIHNHWISAKYNYGVPWSRVIVILGVAVLVIGAIAAGYLRLRHESRRREAADSKLREVAGNLPGVVFKAQRDSDGRLRFPYLTGRPEPLFGIDAEAIVADARALFARIHPDDRAGVLDAIAAAEQARSEINADFRVATEDGSIRWVRVNALPRQTQPGEDAGAAGYTGYFLDVTHAHAQAAALEAAKELAEAATRAKSNFLATMSHEIRTPMGGMVGMLELLEQSRLDDDQHVLLGHMHDSARALQDILDDILDVSKIEAGHLRIEHAPLQPRVLADSVVMHIAAICRKKGLRLDARIDAAVQRFYLGDAMRLRQVLLNLLGNAVKFTERGGVWLDIRLEPGAAQDRAGNAGALLRIEAGDTGIGMDPEQVARVFEPFHQADDSTSRRFGGTGLGLSICRSLVELMGGAIHIDSAVGEGTRVIATVPLGLFDAPGADNAGLRVAVTLDDARRADALRQLLLALGHEPVGSDAPAELWFDDGDAANTVRVVRMPGTSAAADYVIDANPLLHLHVVRACAWARDPSGEGQSERDYTAPAAVRHDARILVVEDNAVNRELIRRQLLQLGYGCDLCNDGRSALAALQHGGYDLLLTDCQMPLMDGYTLTREIRACERERERGGLRLPIVAITASALPEQVDLCRAAGMDAYLTKPVHLAELRETLQRWIPAQSRSHDAAGVAAQPQTDAPALTAAFPQVYAQELTAAFPPALHAVLPLLLRELPHDQERLAQALASGSGAAVAAAVHRVVGSVALYDAEIARAGQQLEARLLSQPLPELLGEADAFAERLQGLRERLQQAIGPG